VILSRCHETLPLLLMNSTLAAMLVWRGRRTGGLVMAFAVPAGMVLNWSLKQAFTRARPALGEPVQLLSGYSFPSGHAAGAALFYGFIALMLWQGLRGRRARHP